MKKLFVSVVALLAAVSLSAQDVTAIYNEAAAAFGAKDFAGAAAKFEQVIEQGLDSEEAASLVATAKTTLPKCYFMMGGGAIRTKNYDEALKNFTKSAELAELYGDMSQMAKANGWVAKIYQIQGGDAFNNKDYATAAGVFEKGYKADPDNTAMALNLAMSYCEMGEYEKGMDIYEAVAAKTHPKYADDAAKAKEMIALYTNNKVATLQAANDFDGIIAMADALLAKNAENALAQKVRLQAYASKKDYNKVIELGEAAAKVQTDPEDVSLMYLTLGAAYNAKEMKPQTVSLRPHEINRRAGSGFPEPAFSCRSGGLVQRSDGSSGAAFRRAFSRMRVSPLRVSGVRPQRASNAASSMPSHVAASIASGSNTASNAALRCCGARRFQGQRLWHASQPKIQP